MPSETPSARRVDSPGIGRASWIEVSDSYVKARFTCPECGVEVRVSVDELINVGKPLCTACNEDGETMKYSGTFYYS